MIKPKSYFLLFLIILIVFAFKFHSFIAISDVRDEIKVSTELREIKPLLGIEETIKQYDSIFSSEIIESGTVGAAVVITYKNQVAFQKCYGVKKTGINDD